MKLEACFVFCQVEGSEMVDHNRNDAVSVEMEEF